MRQVDVRLSFVELKELWLRLGQPGPVPQDSGDSTATR